MSTIRRFGTFQGVFTPTILTILGVIMYLRLGWVVGNAGLVGAVLIILLAKVATITTGLSIATMATNVRVGAGGLYMMISRSLGLEVGGAIGIPLYLSLTLSIAMYIVGFTEGWMAIFPDHNPLLVKSCTLVLLLALSYIGAGLALKAQYVVLVFIFASLVSLFLASGQGVPDTIVWGNFEEAPFWKVFAIFFPAVTGIAAGAAMSGDLKDPKRNLPIGILTAIGVSMLIYLSLAVWFSYSIPKNALLSNYSIMIDVARWRPLVLAGLLGASLSSALGTLLGGPRTLMALGQDRVIPFSRLFANRSKRGEPRVAILFTAILVEICMIFGDLDSIAPLLTMFFLITYGTINLAVFLEKKIGITSYRPSFNVPLVIPIIGAIWCAIAMFLISPIFAGLAVIIIAFVYLAQVRMDHRSPWGDIRAGLFTAIAEWAVRMAALMPASAKSWKPNIIVPVEDPEYWRPRISFLRDIVYPKGSVRLFTVKVEEQGPAERIQRLARAIFGRNQVDSEKAEQDVSALETDLQILLAPLRQERILAAGTVIESNHFLEGISIVTQSLKDMPLPPNVMFLSMSDDPEKDFRLQEMISIAIRESLGIILLSPHTKKALGEKEMINLWLRGGGANRHLTMLTAVQLGRNWDSTVRVLRVVDDELDVGSAQQALRRIGERARLPLSTEYQVLTGDFLEQLESAPRADLNIFGIGSELDIDQLHHYARKIDTSCLFVRDSGTESVLA